MNENTEMKNEKEMPMKWYKFVIYVQLFVNALINLRNGALYFYHGGMSTAYNILGIFSILGAVYAVIVRQFLAHYKKIAPILYYINWAFSIVLSAVEMYLGPGEINYVSLSIGIAILVDNVVYFKKRKHLFVN